MRSVGLSRSSLRKAFSQASPKEGGNTGGPLQPAKISREVGNGEHEVAGLRPQAGLCKAEVVTKPWALGPEERVWKNPAIPFLPCLLRGLLCRAGDCPAVPSCLREDPAAGKWGRQETRQPLCRLRMPELTP